MTLVATQVKRRRGTTAENDAFTGAEGEITVDTEKHELRVHDGMTQGGFKIGGGSGSGRNIGDIFMTKRTDSGLSGAVECNGGTYNTTDYDGDGSIGELLEAGKLDYISLTDYATAISTKGWCDKIGWNGAGTTSFRVPTLTPRIIQTNNIPVVGNGMALGLTDGTHNAGLLFNNSGTLQPYTGNYGRNIGIVNSGSAVASIKSGGVTTDPTKSGIIANTSDTAQLRVMFQLFNGTTDEAVATVGTVVAQVGTVVAQVGALNAHRLIDFQIPTAENGYTWYRKYSDGWVEQGGFASKIAWTGQGGGKTITLPIVMSDSNYTVSATIGKNNTSWNYPGCRGFAESTTKITLGIATLGNNQGTVEKVYWQVSGMAL